MPEYLAPGVYIEEVSYRAKSIEGVSTSTAGFVGPARFGPISGEPELLTSQADYERIYGSLDDLVFGGTAQANYLAHAVRAFFEEGGKRLYVGRIYNADNDGFQIANGVPTQHYADVDIPALAGGGASNLSLVARFPGQAGNLRVTFAVRAGANAKATITYVDGTSGPGLTRVNDGDIVHVRRKVLPVPVPTPDPAFGTLAGNTTDGLYVAYRNADGTWTLADGTAPANRRAVSDAVFTNSANQSVEIRPVTVTVEVEQPSGVMQTLSSPMLLGEFNSNPRALTGITNTFARNPATRLQALTVPFAFEGSNSRPADDTATLAFVRQLLTTAPLTELLKDNPDLSRLRKNYTLTGGDDGIAPTGPTYAGIPAGVADYQNNPLDLPKNGLLAFEGLEDISIIAGPGYSELGETARQAAHNALINHCERMRYRIAVLDTPSKQLISGALAFRNQRSSKYGALYYPWVVVANPLGSGTLALPPSGFVAGIYARNDIEHAVFKAPANEVVRLALDFEQRLNKAQQEALNPEGVNCLRFFEGRGYLLWGARTISDDPEWKYVNLRRYFAYLERSIDRSTQWAVFEINSRPLWDNIRRTIEDFLFNEWKMGGLLGDKPEQAYFVRCDLSTMTQNDLDNGRLVCQIGVAAVRPAEFVIFRIGQWTASANN